MRRPALAAALLAALVLPRAAAQDAVPARIRAAREIEVSAEVAGRVVERKVARNALVAKDQVVLRIDPTFYRIALERAEAALAEAGAELRLAEAELARVRSLFGSGAADEATLDRQVLQHAVAVAAQAAARAARDEAQEWLARTEVKSPEAGLVSEITPEVGAMVQRGAPAFRLLTVQDLVAEAFLEPRRIAGIAEGRTLEVVVRGSDMLKITGTVRELARGAGRERLFRLVVALAEPPPAVVAGLDADVLLPGTGGAR